MEHDKQARPVHENTVPAGQPSRAPIPAARSGAVGTRKATWLQRVFIGLVIAALGFGGGWLGARSYTRDSSNTVNTQRVVLNEQGDLISSIAQEVGASVVSVNVTSQSDGGYGFFGYTRGVEQQSAGTGIIISDDGLIITNRHVVPAETTQVSVVLSDGTEFDNVRVVGRTSERDTLDIAFLQIENLGSQKLTAAKIGTSSDMRVGDSVVAIGNALGQFQNSVTTGIISGYGRSVQAGSSTSSSSESLDDLFQTDAAINQGNSGGPLVNLNGEVIGINTAVAGGAENIGFAIPIDNVRGLMKSVRQTGELKRPYLGIVYVRLTDDIAREFDLDVRRGAFIPRSSDYGRDTIADNGPAERAGIREGDVITKINDTAVDETTSLTSILGQFVPGDEVRVTVNRNGNTETITVELGTVPSN